MTSGTALAGYGGVRVLVLGIGGFIGRHVAVALGRAGAEVHGAVRDAAGVEPWVSRGGIRIHAVDLERPRALRDLLSAVEPAAVFNLAGYGVQPEQGDEDRARRINAALPARLAAAVSAPPAAGVRLVHVGSAFEYGDVGGSLIEDGPARPATLYGRTKLEGTRALVDTCRGRGVPAVVARLFSVYGPGEREHRLLPSLLRAARTGAPAPLTEGSQQRDFTYVGDVAEGLLRLGQASVQEACVANLATGELTSVRDFALTAARELGVREDLLRFGDVPTRAGEMAHTPVTLDRLAHLVGWRPTTSVGEGIRLTVRGRDGAA